MTNMLLEAEYQRLLKARSAVGLRVEQAIADLGHLVDAALDLRRPDGIMYAREWLLELRAGHLTDVQSAQLSYFESNISGNLRELKLLACKDQEARERLVWAWEQDELEQQIRQLREASTSRGFKLLPLELQCSVFTNSANALDTVGRFIEAIDCYARAVRIRPDFGMALGNLGMSFYHYAITVYDPGHRGVLIRAAYHSLERALSCELSGDARECFAGYVSLITAIYSREQLAQDSTVTEHSLGDTVEERKFRTWCLQHKLFLNPLNDIGHNSNAAQDVLSAPNVVLPLGVEIPIFHALFDQLKQEYAAARYMLHASLEEERRHFADERLFLYNTLDYPEYGIALEQTKVAFRLAYSLFDKIASFLQAYFGIQANKAYFRSIWYLNENRKNGLNPQIQSQSNWPLRGLFWVSKDIFESKNGFRDALEPDARDWDKVRNHLEHKFLRLHSEQIGVNSAENSGVSPELLYSMDSGSFRSKTLKILQTVRSSLIYLSLAIHKEEQVRQLKQPGTVIPVLLSQLIDPRHNVEYQ